MNNSLRDRFIRLRELVNVKDKNQYDYLLESPQRSSEIDISYFSDIGKNHDLANVFIKLCKNKNIGAIDGCSIFSNLKDDNYTDMFIRNGHISAFFRYKIRNNKLIEEIVWQDPMRYGFCRKIIFEYYLKKYNEIVSDCLLTELGEKYWKKLIEEALKRKFKVFALCEDETEQIVSVEDSETYFGFSSEYKDVRLSIKK